MANSSFTVTLQNTHLIYLFLPLKKVTLLDAFETSKMTMLKFDTLPGTDVLTYLAERSTYSEQMVSEITAQVLDALSYIHWRGKVRTICGKLIQGGPFWTQNQKLRDMLCNIVECVSMN